MHLSNSAYRRSALQRTLLKRAAALAVLIAAIVTLLLAVPSLGTVRHRIGDVNPWWLLAALGFELASCASFVAVFRAYFPELPAVRGRQIGWIELGAGALLPGGGVTSFIFGGMLLKRDGLERHDIVVRSGGIFWITSLVSALGLLFGAVLLIAPAGPGAGFARDWIPVFVVVPLTAAIMALPLITRFAPRSRAAIRLGSLIEGVGAAWSNTLRTPSWRMFGAIGYFGFDVAVIWALFRGLDYHPDAGELLVGYVVGYAAAMIPVPGGFGVVEGGLTGALVLYGTPAAQTAAVALLYHAFVFWVPTLGGIGAWLRFDRTGSAEPQSPAEAQASPSLPAERPRGLRAGAAA